MQTKLPEAITRDLFILACKRSWETEYSVTFASMDYSEYSDEYILLATDKITIKIPQIDLALAEITVLRKKMEKILADSELKKKI